MSDTITCAIFHINNIVCVCVCTIHGIIMQDRSVFCVTGYELYGRMKASLISFCFLQKGDRNEKGDDYF